MWWALTKGRVDWANVWASRLSRLEPNAPAHTTNEVARSHKDDVPVSSTKWSRFLLPFPGKHTSSKEARQWISKTRILEHVRIPRTPKVSKFLHKMAFRSCQILGRPVIAPINLTKTPSRNCYFSVQNCSLSSSQSHKVTFFHSF